MKYFILLIKEIIIDHGYEKYMKFPDVLNDGCVPDYKVSSSITSQNQSRKQKGVFGIMGL